MVHIDPHGELWFKINGEWAYLKGINEITKNSIDKNGNLIVTVTAGRETFLTFNGGELKLFKGDGGVRTFKAVSGELDDQGRTQPHLQAQEGRGPLPEGRYYFNPALVQRFSDIGLAQKSAAILKRGEWPGGRIAWGDYRVELTPASSTETYGRGGFFMHGGFFPGSAGCIDLCGRDGDFFNAVPSVGYEILVYP